MKKDVLIRILVAIVVFVFTFILWYNIITAAYNNYFQK